MILTGAYDQTGHYYYLTIGQIALDDMGDDVMLSNGAFGYSPYKWNQYTYDYTQYARINDGWWSSYCSYLWRKAYTAINQCNLIIENADNLPEGCEDYLAQAHGLRGWNFLNLYHLFCPAYLNKTLGGDNGKGLFLRLSSASSDKSTDVPRSDLKASMQQIIDDLTYAYEHCSSTSNYYINKKNAALFLARTYLEMGNYQKASEFAEIAASNTFDGSNLMSQEEYQTGFMTANSEWLWGFKFDSESTNIYASIPSFYHAATAMDANSTFGTANYGKQVPGDKVDDRVKYLAKMPLITWLDMVLSVSPNRLQTYSRRMRMAFGQTVVHSSHSMSIVRMAISQLSLIIGVPLVLPISLWGVYLRLISLRLKLR